VVKPGRRAGGWPLRHEKPYFSRGQKAK